MTTIDRRRLLQLLGSAPLAAGFAWTGAEVEAAQRRTREARRASSFTPAFFTAPEYATVVLLAEMIIPADERSGGAAEAGVPEFIDFMMIDQPARQVPMRGGLAWLDRECVVRFGRLFAAAADAERRALLDDISGLDPAPPASSHGIAFFRSFRDLVATGFWTSRIGIADLQFTGNVFVAEWNGCPEDALKKLGLA